MHIPIIIIIRAWGHRLEMSLDPLALNIVTNHNVYAMLCRMCAWNDEAYLREGHEAKDGVRFQRQFYWELFCTQTLWSVIILWIWSKQNKNWECGMVWFVWYPSSALLSRLCINHDMNVACSLVSMMLYNIGQIQWSLHMVGDNVILYLATIILGTLTSFNTGKMLLYWTGFRPSFWLR